METMTYSQFVASRFKNPGETLAGLTPRSAAMLHAAVGIVGEVIELFQSDTMKNTLEELGDIVFYCEAMGQLVGYKHPEQLDMLDADSAAGIATVNKAVAMLLEAAGDMLDTIKKHAIYGKVLDVPRVHIQLQVVLTQVAVVGEANAYYVDGIKRLNVKKLTQRYPAGYTDAAAQARADKHNQEDLPM